MSFLFLGGWRTELAAWGFYTEYIGGATKIVLVPGQGGALNGCMLAAHCDAYRMSAACDPGSSMLCPS